MGCSVNQHEEDLGRIWTCLDLDDATSYGDDNDLIGLTDVVGFDFWERRTGNIYRQSVVKHLTQESIEDWLRSPLGSEEPGEDCRFGRLLIANQAIAGDLLRPLAEVPAVRFSQKLLGLSINLPPAALSQLCHQTTWFLDFEGFETSGSVRCEGLATGFFSFLRVHDDQQMSFAGIMVCHPSMKRHERDRLLSEIEFLSFLSREPAYLPYLITMLSLRIESSLVDFHTHQARQTDLHLDRFATQRRPDDLFGETHGRASALAAVEINVRNTLKLAGKWRKLVLKRPKGKLQEGWSCPKKQKKELSEGLDYCMQMLHKTADTAGQTQDQTNRQLTTTLNMMAYEQQKLTRSDQQTSIQIAEASKIIAEETKKDGYSMKTLAVVTIIFLPATSVSSIMAMPLFRWDDDWVVNKRLWVYFAFAVPLTALTVGLWYVWQRQAMRRASQRLFSKC